MIINSRFLEIDRQEIERSITERDMYLLISIRNYLDVLQNGDSSLAVYRIISLWFSNSINEEVNNVVAEVLPTVPTYRLVPLLYQMAARMSSIKGKGASDFSVILFNVIRKCTAEHPHHALPIMFALKNALLDENFEKDSKSKSLKPDERTIVAELIIKQLVQ